MHPSSLPEFGVNNSYDHLPELVKERTKLAILNLLAVTIGANTYPQARDIVSACRSIQPGALPIFGARSSAGVYGSAWANSALAHLLDFDDTHLGTIVHPSAPVIPAVLALGMERGRSGKDIMYASALGMETSLRLALSVGLDERYSNWHNTSLFGTAASALASAIIMGGNESEVSASMLQGLTVATGFMSNKGTMSKSFQVGRSSAEGIISAIAAMKGITVSDRILYAFGTSLSRNFNVELLNEDLGKEWHLLKNYLKPYPCGVVLHPGIDAAIQMRENGLVIGDIESVDVYVNPIVMVLTSILEPKTGLQSKFSVTHAIACAMLKGKLFPEHFSDDVVNDSAVLEIRDKIRVHEEEDYTRGQTRIVVTKRNGERLISEVNRGSDTPSSQLDADDVKFKFDHLVDPVLGKDKAKEIWEYFSDLERKSDFSEASNLFY